MLQTNLVLIGAQAFSAMGLHARTHQRFANARGGAGETTELNLN